MKIIAVKHAALVEADLPARGILWLDQIMNGLLSRALYKGFFSPRRSEEFIWMRPGHGEVASIFLWTGSARFPWTKLGGFRSELTEIFWEGNFSMKEIEEGEKLLGNKILQWAQVSEKT